MISWGHKVDRVAFMEEKSESFCQICKKVNRQKLLIEQNYFLLYWMPIARTKRYFYKICSICSCRTNINQKNQQLLNENDSVLFELQQNFPKRMKLKYIWGNFVFLILLSLVVWIFMKLRK